MVRKRRSTIYSLLLNFVFPFFCRKTKIICEWLLYNKKLFSQNKLVYIFLNFYYTSFTLKYPAVSVYVCVCVYMLCHTQNFYPMNTFYIVLFVRILFCKTLSDIKVASKQFFFCIIFNVTTYMFFIFSFR